MILMRDIINVVAEGLERLAEGASLMRVYRGVPTAANDGYDTAFGLFFSDSFAVAKSYAGYNGKVITSMLDVSHALHWTPNVARDFQDYVISWRRQSRLPPGARIALTHYNRTWDADLTMAQAIGMLLRQSPSQLGHHELDPLMGFTKNYAKDRGCNVVIRPHEEGGGMKDGTNEYIVFSKAAIKLPDIINTVNEGLETRVVEEDSHSQTMILEAETRLFHGTQARFNGRKIRVPAWFSDLPDTAEWYAANKEGYVGSKNPRVIEFETKRDYKLVLLDQTSDLIGSSDGEEILAYARTLGAEGAAFKSPRSWAHEYVLGDISGLRYVGIVS